MTQEQIPPVLVPAPVKEFKPIWRIANAAALATGTGTVMGGLTQMGVPPQYAGAAALGYTLVLMPAAAWARDKAAAGGVKNPFVNALVNMLAFLG